MRSVRQLSIVGILCSLLFAGPAFAQVQGSVIADFSGSVQAIIGAYSGMVPGSVTTRPTGTSAYSANQTICAATSVTVCTPGTIPIAAIQFGRLTAKRVVLLKSGAAVAGTSFTIWFYSALPGTASPLQFDATAYTGPRTADIPNYLGSALCTNGTVTSDTSPSAWYECTLNPATNGALVLQAALQSRNVYYLISATAAYATPVALETFTPYVGGVF